MNNPQNQKTHAERPEDQEDTAPLNTATETAATAGEAAAAAGEAAGGPAPAEGAAAAATPERVNELEAELARLKDQLLRALAETENVRRRAEREREDTAKFAIARFAKDMLPVADNLRRALEAVPPEMLEGHEMVRQFVAGVEATERQLLEAFARAGIAKIDPLGEIFDPHFHQVMTEVEGTGKPPGTVVQVLQPGYVIQGRLLREALVAVAKRSGDEAGQHVDTTA